MGFCGGRLRDNICSVWNSLRGLEPSQPRVSAHSPSRPGAASIHRQKIEVKVEHLLRIVETIETEGTTASLKCVFDSNHPSFRQLRNLEPEPILKSKTIDP
jgi:hypothetical protein